MRPLPLCLAALALLFSLVLAREARARPSFDASDGKLEERFAEGELDEEDLARVPALGRRGAGGGNVLARTWVSLVAFRRELPSGMIEIGGMAVVGLAFDKIAQGRVSSEVHRSFADGPSTPLPRPSSRPDTPRLAIDAALARGAVRAAWRTSGIEVNDARIDDMIARSRLSAALPETRLRAMELLTDAQHATTYVNSGGLIDLLGAKTTLEARLTWRFDRLLYADDETSLERLRLEREDTRNRIGGRVLELIFTWQRALLDGASSESGSRAELDATLRQFEAEISLDVLTGGWFGAQPLVRANGAGPVKP